MGTAEHQPAGDTGAGGCSAWLSVFDAVDGSVYGSSRMSYTSYTTTPVASAPVEVVEGSVEAVEGPVEMVEELCAWEAWTYFRCVYESSITVNVVCNYCMQFAHMHC